jgi:hypothetical protein
MVRRLGVEGKQRLDDVLMKRASAKRCQEGLRVLKIFAEK